MSVRAGRDEFSASETRLIRAVSQARASSAFLIDLAVVVGMTATHVLALFFTPPPSGLWAWPLLLSVPALCALLVRRQFPWSGLVVLLVATIWLMSLDIEIGPLNLAILVSVYSITSHGGLWVTAGAAVLAMAYPVARLPCFEWPFGEGMMMLVGEAIELMIVVGWGWSIRVGRQRAAQLQQGLSMLDEARDQFAADAAAIERARLAREFHDIVSHNLAVVALRSGVARTLVDRDPTHARETLTELEHSSRAALGEMRELLGALRTGTGEDDDAEPTPGAVEEQQRRPAPTLEGLDALVNSVRGSGLVWKVDRRGSVRELGPGVEMTAYRIVQEAVTNVLKHAGFGKARVVLDYGDTSLSIEVTNKVSTPDTDPPLEPHTTQASPLPIAPRTDQPSAGHGLIGLRERVAILGGTLTAYPVPNGFHLAAVLPCPEDPQPV